MAKTRDDFSEPLEEKNRDQIKTDKEIKGSAENILNVMGFKPMELDIHDNLSKKEEAELELIKLSRTIPAQAITSQQELEDFVNEK